MFRPLVIATVVLLSVPAAAQAPAAYYVATPDAAPVKPRLITRSTSWHVRDGSYVAARGAERDTILCQLVARAAGPLTAFTVGGRAFDAAALARCNGKNATAD